MNLLLAITAIIEAATGSALLVLPSIVVRLLLGAPLESSAEGVIARVAGAALLALGVVCWLARNDTHSAAARIGRLDGALQRRGSCHSRGGRREWTACGHCFVARGFIARSYDSMVHRKPLGRQLAPTTFLCGRPRCGVERSRFE